MNSCETRKPVRAPRLQPWLTLGATLLLAACAAHKTQPPPSAPVHAAVAHKAAAGHKAKALETPSVAPVPDKAKVLAVADVGYYLDVLQGRLQQSVDPAVVVSRASRSIILDFSRRISFNADGTQLGDAERKLLEPLSKVLAEYRPTRVSIYVSADDVEAGARAVAQLRAEAIARALAQSGTSAARIKAAVPDAAQRSGDTRVQIELEPVTHGE